MMKIAISGASGRMGKMLIEAVVKADDMTLAAALCPTGDAMIGQDAGAFMGAATGVLVTDDIEALKGCDVLIDFTRPAGTLAYLAFCREHGIGVVIGTTGFDAQGKAAIEAAAGDIPVVFAPNMSVGVNAAFKLIEVAAKLLADYDCEIVEMHHKHKVDAPSGTALEMGRRVAAARGAKFEDVGRAFPRRPHGRTPPRLDRLCRPARRRRRGRPYGDFRKHRRAHRDQPQVGLARRLRPRVACRRTFHFEKK